MKCYTFWFILFLPVAVWAQQPQPATGTRHKMAIFTPLYLDQAFDGEGTYRFGKTQFPKNSIQGLEFYHGASFAIDSLNKLQIPLDVYIYDSKSESETLEQQFSKCAADGVEMIIANCAMSDLAALARLGADKKITVVNATVPNNANSTDNPYFVVLNSTLRTQIEGIYHYIKNRFPGKQVTILTRNMQSEKYIRSAFEALNDHFKNPVSIKFQEINDDIALKALGTTTQPTQTGLYITGSLDTDFGSSILKQFSKSSKNYASLTVIGMPTWENINLKKSEYKGVEIVYSTPFYHSGTDAVSRAINRYYNEKMYARPSDLVFRAYGLTYRFGHLLNRYGKDINNKLAGTEYQSLFAFDIQPVYQNGVISHHENKKLYYLKYFNGALKEVN